MMVDYLIVGQGIAGSLLAWELERAGQQVFLIDGTKEKAATAVAAGIINPITGRRFVKSWMIDALLQEAKLTYAALEEELGQQLYFEYPLLRALFNRRDENDWLARGGDDEYLPYMGDTEDAGGYRDISRPAFSYGLIKEVAQVDIAGIRKKLREKWLAQGQLLEADFVYEDLEIGGESIKYQDIEAKRLVFCEGAGARHNPFFGHLPFRLTKGEALFAKIPEAPTDMILKHRVYLAPLPSGQYWVGSTSENEFSSLEPSPASAAFMQERLDDLLLCDYAIEDHQAALRPTVRDRRPFLGQHAEHKTIYIFNGMGTKGASLAPYWAKHMRQYLLGEQELSPEVNISRCKPWHT